MSQYEPVGHNTPTASTTPTAVTTSTTSRTTTTTTASTTPTASTTTAQQSLCTFSNTAHRTLIDAAKYLFVRRDRWTELSCSSSHYRKPTSRMFNNLHSQMSYHVQSWYSQFMQVHCNIYLALWIILYIRKIFLSAGIKDAYVDICFNYGNGWFLATVVEEAQVLKSKRINALPLIIQGFWSRSVISVMFL